MKGIFKTVILATALTAAAGAMAADYGLTPVAVTADKGKTVDLQVVMTNNDLKVTSFQFDLYLPEGVEVSTDEYDAPMATLSANRKRDHIITGAKQNDGAIRFLSYSNNNLIYTGSDGVILTTQLKVDAAPGKYDITIKMGSLTEADTFLETFTPEAKCTITVKDPEADRRAASDAAYATLNAELAGLQTQLNDAQTTINGYTTIDKSKYNSQINEVQNLINSAQLQLDAAKAAYSLTAQSTLPNKSQIETKIATILQSAADEESANLAAVTKPGDFDGNGSVNVNDLQVVIYAILSFTSDSRIDLTGDGVVNAADVTKMIDIVMGR